MQDLRAYIQNCSPAALTSLSLSYTHLCVIRKVLQHLCLLSSVVTRSQCLLRAAQCLWESLSAAVKSTASSLNLRLYQKISIFLTTSAMICVIHIRSPCEWAWLASLPHGGHAVSAQRWWWAPALISEWETEDVLKHKLSPLHPYTVF